MVVETEIQVSGRRVYIYPGDGLRPFARELKDTVNESDGPLLAWWGDPPAGEGHDRAGDWLNLSASVGVRGED